MYKLINETETSRTYKSEITGTEVTTHLLKKDEAGKKWWAFNDLTNIPFIRKKSSDHIMQLYNAGVTRHDLATMTSTLKTILRSNDQERYEKAYAEILRIENIMNTATDPVKQSLSLCTVYILEDKESIDVFDFAKAAKKIEAWTVQPELQGFFLNWLTDGMSAYTTLYAEASKIASMENP